MENYLIEQYDVIEDKRWLKDVSDIEDYFEDIARDYMECGQGFYQDEAEFICKIGDKFYEVSVIAEIGSAKQDVGDRLYWIDSINNITYHEIEKPKPKEKFKVQYNLMLTEYQLEELERFMDEQHIHRSY